MRSGGPDFRGGLTMSTLEFSEYKPDPHCKPPSGRPFISGTRNSEPDAKRPLKPDPTNLEEVEKLVERAVAELAAAKRRLSNLEYELEDDRIALYQARQAEQAFVRKLIKKRAQPWYRHLSKLRCWTCLTRKPDAVSKQPLLATANEGGSP